MDAQTMWLLEGDAVIQYLTHRDLLHTQADMLAPMQALIAQEGIGAHLLSCQNEDGHWGLHYYQPKWTCTHYTLLELKNIGAASTLSACRNIVCRMFDDCQLPSGAMNLAKKPHPGDTCVDGMVLDYAAYFCPEDPRLDALAAHLLSEQKPDGGFTWNARSNSGDPHTTICVLEGLAQYAERRTANISAPLEHAIRFGIEFFLENHLFLNDADKRLGRLTYPSRYRYDYLRALVFFARRNVPYDARMLPALRWLAKKRTKEGLWRLEYVHPGNVHFEIEKKGMPSRFITLNALIVSHAYGHMIEG